MTIKDLLPLVLLISCARSHEQCKQPPEQPVKPVTHTKTVPRNPVAPARAVDRKGGKKTMDTTLDTAVADRIISTLTGKFPKESGRIARSVRQVAALWRTDVDGPAKTFETLCTTHFAGDPKVRAALFDRLEHNMEILKGHQTRINLELSRPIHVDLGPNLAVDKLFAAYSPSAHLTEDLYRSKIGFIVALNFPAYSLKEKNTLGSSWSRQEWAYARMGDVFTERVPAEVKQRISTAMTEADDYISHYNIFMGSVVDTSKKSLFPKKMKLISHWNLRDELKSRYADKKSGLAAQRTIYAVMKRIIDQSIPTAVIDKGDHLWDPIANTLEKDGKSVPVTREPDTRYAFLLKNFQAMKAYDPYSPTYPTYVERAFDRDLEYSYDEIEKLFVSLVGSPETKQVGTLIAKRLGRPLEAFDIWYDGFKTRSGIDPKKLSEKTRGLYKSADDFHKGIPVILRKLGFPDAKAASIAARIQVDPSRGAGHAVGAEMRSDRSHLRTRVGKEGMDYKGYNIAVHELGHNVEQTITLQDVDHYMMHGVPNTAFTEAWAFVFQKRDLALLGMEPKNADAAHLSALDTFWSAYEIMGVSLVDMRVWKWLYKHPDATPAQLRKAVIDTALAVWNTYFAPVFGKKDEPVLAIYSHMIDYPLYLPAYPIGHLAEFQIERHMRGKVLGTEMERILKQGRLTPDTWMKGAVGDKLSVAPMLAEVRAALKVVI